MNSAACIAQLNAVTGLDLKLNADEAVSFDYQGRQVLIRFLPDLNAFVFFVELAVLEEAAVATALPMLLDANFLFSDTEGGSFSYDPESRMVGLNYLCSGSNSDEQVFINQINRMLAAADTWVTRIHEFNEQAIALEVNRLAALRDGQNDQPVNQPMLII